MFSEPDRKIKSDLVRLIEKYDNAQASLAHYQQLVDKAERMRDTYKRGFDNAAKELEAEMIKNGMAKIGHEAYVKSQKAGNPPEWAVSDTWIVPA